MSDILKTCTYVSNHSKSVVLNADAINRFAEKFSENNIQHWLLAAPFDFTKLTDEQKLNFLLVFNSISFSYWGSPKWTTDYKGKQYDGAWAMIVAIGRALEEGRDILDATYRSNITLDEFKDVFRGNVEISLIEERWEITKETGDIISKKYQDSFANVVLESNKDAVRLLNLIITNFPSFNDTSDYKGQTVYFYKRAQLLASDIYQLFNHSGYGELKNISEITACADYKLPQELRKQGILTYTPELIHKVDNKIELAHGSPEEVEIRANTIVAVEKIRQAVSEHLPEVLAMDINDYLWLSTQIKYPEDRPYHLTRTTAY